MVNIFLKFFRIPNFFGIFFFSINILPSFAVNERFPNKTYKITDAL